MEARELAVPPEAAGSRLDRYLSGLPGVGSRGAAERLLAAGAVHVDGKRQAKSHRLLGGETLLVEGSAEVAAPQPPPAGEIRVAYEDEHLLVVDKPAGLVVHHAPGHAGDTLVDALGERLGGGEPGRTGVVHRLDRQTSGLLVLARTDEAHARLADLVRRRVLERGYLALVSGQLRSRSGRIEAPIGRDRHDPLRHSLDTDTPRAAVTHFERLRPLGRHTLLSVRLETGRTHQIRVHLAAIGLPVVGDAVYGTPDPVLPRQFLHAASLAFPHPFGDARIETTSPLPRDLAAYLEALE